MATNTGPQGVQSDTNASGLSTKLGVYSLYYYDGEDGDEQWDPWGSKRYACVQLE